MVVIINRLWWQIFRPSELMLLDRSKQGNQWYGYSTQVAQTDFGVSCVEDAINHRLVYESNSADLGTRCLFPTNEGDSIGMSDYDKIRMADSVRKTGRSTLYILSVAATISLTVIEIIKILQTA